VQVDRNLLGPGAVVACHHGDEDAAEKLRHLVAVGRTWCETSVAIVDPEHRRPLAPLQVGEIWVASDSVAAGYLDRSDTNAAIFAARLDGRTEAFLRTGDLGFVDEAGDLFVTGRLSDLIIIRGKNFYPQDIETDALQCGAGLGQMAVAFSPGGGDSRVFLFVELQDGVAPESLAESARKDIVRRVTERIWERHELRVNSIVLLPARSIPKTTSGKVRRHECFTKYGATETGQRAISAS
jgi:acyl-CoA synthetase (AMP-forming)/AMP-acid ligase II